MSSASFLTRLGLGAPLARLRENRRLWRGFHQHSRTFSLAARLLPRRVRLPVATLYLFCRRVDTIADERAFAVGPARALEELEATARCLDATLAGTPPPEMLWQRLADVHARYQLAPGPLHELVEGARWDLEGRTVDDEADLLAYSMLVGGSVGAMMLPFLTARDTHARLETAARALGVAMQITNIVRDVGEDLRQRDRLYLPADWLHAEGLSEADLRAHLATDGVPPAYPRVLERAMHAADRRYRIGMDGIQALPPKMRLGIRSAARMYREIQNEVRANAYDDLSERAYTSLPRKLRLVLQDDYASRRAALRPPSVLQALDGTSASP